MGQNQRLHFGEIIMASDLVKIQSDIQEAKLALAKRVAPDLIERANRVAARKRLLFPWLRVWWIMRKLAKLSQALNG